MDNLITGLGISVWEFLYHLGVILALIIVLGLVLYKPMKKLIKKNRDKLSSVFDENKKLNKEAEEMKGQHNIMVSEMKQEAAKISADAAIKAKEKSDAVINEAKVQAGLIINSANKTLKAGKLRQDVEFNETVSELSVAIASKILQREVKAKDNEKIIEECLEDWSKES